MIQLILILCLSSGGACVEHQVTPDVPLSLTACMTMAAQRAASEWVQEHPGYVLRGWRCRIGAAGQAI